MSSGSLLPQEPNSQVLSSIVVKDSRNLIHYLSSIIVKFGNGFDGDLVIMVNVLGC